MRLFLLLVVLVATVTACHSRARYAKTRDPIPDDISEAHFPIAFASPPAGTGTGTGTGTCGISNADRRRLQNNACPRFAREAHAFGPPPREPPPAPQCPMRVRLGSRAGGRSENEIIVDTFTMDSGAFDDVPWDECVPPQFLVGARRAFHVEDGWLLGYTGYGEGELVWSSEDGRERRTISSARIVGFSRAPSGTILGLAIGKARLGKGGVLALERSGDHGTFTPRLIAALPLEPSPVAFDDNGAVVGYAQGFLFRVDETGKVENLHYIARSIGRVSSIAKTPNGTFYLGLECGVLKIVPAGDGSFREEWWSARDGASGRWSPCAAQ